VSMLGWTPKTHFREGIQLTLAHFRQLSLVRK
jgi:hypothetical protein